MPTETPKIVIHNVETGEITQREMTAEEIAALPIAEEAPTE